MMISKKAVFVFEIPATAHLAASQINGRYSHVAKVDGKFLTLTAGMFELLESKRVAFSLGGNESESEESKTEKERDHDSRWKSPRAR
jgi:hypothetical protein